MHLAFFTYLIPLPTSARHQDYLKTLRQETQKTPLIIFTAHEEIQRAITGLQKDYSIETPDIIVVDSHWSVLHQCPLHESLHLKNLLLHGEHCLVSTILLLQVTDEDRGYRISELWIGHL